MRSLLIVIAVVGVAVARPANLGLGLHAGGLFHAPLSYSSVVSPVAYSTIAAPAPAPVAYAAPYAAPVSSQFHAQDELGQYSYGYAGGPSAKSEVKTWDGVTRGGYSYVDAEGKLQTVNYVADAVNGFRVAATNLPVAPEVPAVPDVPAVPEVPASEPLVAPTPVEDTAEVAAAKEAHFAAYAEAKAAAEAAPEEVAPVAVAAVEPAAVAIAAPAPVAIAAPAPFAYSAHHVAPFAYSAPIAAPVAAPITYSAPAPITYSAPAPITYSAPAPLAYHSVAPYAAAYAAPVSSQFHAQDELGQYSYGYAGGPSAKSEIKSWDGVTRGGYSYVDAEGKLQTVNYVADAFNGFRVAATNLPVAPAAPEAPVLETVPDTAEVAAAKAEHLAAVEEAKARLASA